MERTTPLEVVMTALFASLMGVEPALAAGSYPPCETFVLHGGPKEIAGLDLGPEGEG